MSASERAHACRLTPDRALTTLDEAAEWIAERGLVTLMPCCSLPSLFAACHEEPYSAHARGFGGWPKTKYWWPFALGQRPDVYALKIHRGKTLLVSEPVARLADPLCRAALAEAERGEHGPLLRHLAAAGPSLVEDLKAELGPVKRARAQLERVGALVAGTIETEDSYFTELRRWDQLFPEPSAGGIEDLVVAGIAAAVVAPERELRTWFSWPLGDAVERLVEGGRLARDGGLVSLSSGS